MPLPMTTRSHCASQVSGGAATSGMASIQQLRLASSATFMGQFPLEAGFLHRLEFGHGQTVGLDLSLQLLLADRQLLTQRVHVEAGGAGLREQPFQPLLLLLDVMLDLL